MRPWHVLKSASFISLSPAHAYCQETPWTVCSPPLLSPGYLLDHLHGLFGTLYYPPGSYYTFWIAQLSPTSVFCVDLESCTWLSSAATLAVRLRLVEVLTSNSIFFSSWTATRYRQPAVSSSILLATLFATDISHLCSSIFFFAFVVAAWDVPIFSK